MMVLTYTAHPVSAPDAAGIAANLARAKRWIAWIYRHYPDIAVVANWLIDCEILDDSNPAHREVGLRRDEAIVARCDQLWLLGGRISSGMAREKAAAEAHGVQVFDLTSLGDEPPTDAVEIDTYWVDQWPTVAVEEIDADAGDES